MFLLFFIIVELYFLIAAVIAQVFHATTDLVMSTRIADKEVKAVIEKHIQ